MRIYKVQKQEETKYWVYEYLEQDNDVSKRAVALFETEYDANRFIQDKEAFEQFRQDIKDGKITGVEIDF